MNKLTDKMWIGDIDDVRTRPLDKLDIDVVITVCQDSVEDNISSEILYHWFDIADGEAASKWGGSDKYVDFRDAALTVLTYIEDGKTVFTHCHHGQSRSAAVCIAVEATLRGDKPVSPAALYSEVEYEFKQERQMINPDTLLQKHAVMFIGEYR